MNNLIDHFFCKLKLFESKNDFLLTVMSTRRCHNKNNSKQKSTWKKKCVCAVHSEGQEMTHRTIHKLHPYCNNEIKTSLQMTIFNQQLFIYLTCNVGGWGAAAQEFICYKKIWHFNSNWIALDIFFRENDAWIVSICFGCFCCILLWRFCFFSWRGSRKRAWSAWWPPRQEKKHNRHNKIQLQNESKSKNRFPNKTWKSQFENCKIPNANWIRLPQNSNSATIRQTFRTTEFSQARLQKRTRTTWLYPRNMFMVNNKLQTQPWLCSNDIIRT